MFFFPAASHTEKEGTFTQTQRMLQWRHKAVEPPGDCRSELHFFFHLGRMLRERLADSGLERDRALLDLTWDYPTHGETQDPSADAVLREINGRYLTGDQAGQPLPAFTEMKADGSTDGGLLDLHRRLHGRRQPRGRPHARLGAELAGARLGLGLAGEPPGALQPGLR